MKRGIATFTLDYGKCPPWLFKRMVALGREMVFALRYECGPDEFIKRIGDPVWFQSLGTVLAFDWNASGLTTILTAALKEAIRGHERELGIFICGGKGKTSRKAPDQICDWGNRLSLPDQHIKNLTYNSRMSAKVDSALIQDGFQIYHHTFFFSQNGAWTVVQQGMNTVRKQARRYHWHSEAIDDLIDEPHTAIVSPQVYKKPTVLDLTSRKSGSNRKLALEMINSGFNQVMGDLHVLRRHSSSLSRTITVQDQNSNQLSLLELSDQAFRHHPVELEDFARSTYLQKILWKVCDQKPDSYEKLLATPGVGPKTMRALALVGELIYGAPISYKDPARYSFAHGGKDRIPYPVDCKTYDSTIDIMKRAVRRTRLGATDKSKILTRLNRKRQA